MSGTELSAAFVRTAKPGRYCDGDGLYLLVKKSGARFWVFRYRLHGAKMREAGLGRAGEGRNCVRLSEAREKASVLFRQVRAGIDPLAARDAGLASAKAAAQDAAIRGHNFPRSCATLHRWPFGRVAQRQACRPMGLDIDTYANPSFGDLAVADVATAHVLAALEPIWLTKPETASRLRGRIETILDFAKARGWRSGENPAAWKGHLALTLPARSKVAKVEHHAALPWREIGDFMQAASEPSGDWRSCALLRYSDSGAQRRSTWRALARDRPLDRNMGRSRGSHEGRSRTSCSPD